MTAIKTTRDGGTAGARLVSYPGTPRWVKVFGIIAIVLLQFVLFRRLSGGDGPHSPDRHASSGEAGGHIW
jgi:hypothetical protein